MRDRWAELKIGDFCEIQQGKNLAVSQLSTGQFPVYGANGVVGFYDEYNFSREVVALGCRGSCGTVHLVNKSAWLANNVMAVWPKLESQATCRYLALILETADLKSSGVISGQVQPQITRTSLGPLVCLLPPLEEQKRIVDVVSAVDAYIDALQHQADVARTARKAVLHELLSAGGDDWVETTLGDIAEYINGYPFKPGDLGGDGIAVIRIKQLLDPLEKVDRTTVDVPERCVLRNGDIVFSWSGTLAVRVWNRGPAYLNQHLFRVVEKPGVNHEWLPLVIDHAIEDLVEKSHGTTMKHITKETLLPHQVFLPPLEEQKRIVGVVSSMDDVIQSTEQAVADAKNLRSGLLSDLLSGDHEIPESYDRFLGAA